jgi:hypothetical protein
LNPNQLRALRGAALTFFTIGNFHGWLGCDAALLLALLFEEENPTGVLGQNSVYFKRYYGFDSGILGDLGQKTLPPVPPNDTTQHRQPESQIRKRQNNQRSTNTHLANNSNQFNLQHPQCQAHQTSGWATILSHVSVKLFAAAAAIMSWIY